MLSPTQPALILAPMEGVTDAPMRAVQGELGAFTYAVSEFVRISQVVPPKSTFQRHIPEIHNDAKTRTGLPVQVQLLGGDAGRMAESAAVAVEAGARAIDINFGCPARTVNRHDGGATLLQYPHRIREIVQAVRRALPLDIPVSVKMRLGWDSIEQIDRNAAMAAEGGAAWLTIHGRTRDAGYAPPIYWRPIGRIREQLGIPVVANGDIWTIEDFRRCRDETGCLHYMLGRGALANPTLPYQVALELGSAPATAALFTRPQNWAMRLNRLIDWMQSMRNYPPEFILARLKQWLHMAARFGTFTQFDEVKRAKTIEALLMSLASANG